MFWNSEPQTNQQIDAMPARVALCKPLKSQYFKPQVRRKSCKIINTETYNYNLLIVKIRNSAQYPEDRY